MADPVSAPNVPVPAPNMTIAPSLVSQASAAPAPPNPVAPSNAAAPTLGQNTGDFSAKTTPQDLIDEAGRYYQKAQQIANQPPPPPEPHARLLAMVSGLAEGLSAAGKALATRGKEGGAEEVSQYQAQQQELQMAKQRAQQERQQQQAQMQIVAGDNALKLGQMSIMLQSLPDEISEEHSRAIQAHTDAATKAYELYSTNGDSSGLAALGENVSSDIRSRAVQGWQTAIDAANTALPNDPKIAQQVGIAAQQAKILNDPKSTPEQIDAASRQMASAAQIVSQRAKAMGAATINAAKIHAANAIGQPRADASNKAMQDMYDTVYPGAPLPPEFTLNADSQPADEARVSKGMKQLVSAQSLQANRSSIAANRQVQANLKNPNRIDGDPKLGGDAYVNSLPANIQDTVRGFGNGTVAPEKITYLLSRNQGLVNDVKHAYPDLDTSRLMNYPNLFKDYSPEGKSGTQLTAANIALQHMQQMKQINDANPVDVRVHGTKANTAYNNLANTVVEELMTFYGAPKTNESYKHYADTLQGITVSRDAGIAEQAHAMGVRIDAMHKSWSNSVPNAAYESKLPVPMTDDAKQARAFLDPAYRPMTTMRAPNGQTKQVPLDQVEHYKTLGATVVQ